jgi:hypothetical protein
MIAEANVHRQVGKVGQSREHEVADGCAAEGADRLKGESAERKPVAGGAWDVFRNDNMSGRIVAPEREECGNVGNGAKIVHLDAGPGLAQHGGRKERAAWFRRLRKSR